VKILFDQGTPVPLRLALSQHTVFTAYELGWTEFDNGKLLAAAETEFDVLITTDKNLRYQQNLGARRLAILVLPTTNWSELRVRQSRIVAAVEELRPSQLVELQF
jgi:hypothetical protein